MKPTEPPSQRSSEHPSSRYDDGIVHHPHDDGHGHDDFHNVDVAHEHTDVDVKALIMSAVFLIVVVAVSQFAMGRLFNYFEGQAAAHDPQVSPLARPATQMPNTTNESPYFSRGADGPPLLSNEPAALSKERSEEQKRLQEYGWVSQPTGVAHIPIDEAKKLVLERGLLPVREGAAPPAFTTRTEARGESSGGRTITIQPTEPAAVAPGQAPPQEHGTAPHGQPSAPAKPHNPGGH